MALESIEQIEECRIRVSFTARGSDEAPWEMVRRIQQEIERAQQEAWDNGR